MKHFIAVGTAAVALSLMFGATAAHADAFDSKLQASTFKTKLVQAEDECVSGTTTIGGVDACAPANVNTDGTKFSVGSLAVKSRAVSSQVLTILKSSGNGDTGEKSALGGMTVRTRLVLRITKRTTLTAPTEPVTWSDVVLLCSSHVVTGSGNIVIKEQLAGLLGCNLDVDLNSEQYQKEIISASVINANTGEAIAVPGVRKK
jgi:hypothetical protein